MESLIKPFGAFLEYTVLPIIDRSRELIELAESRGLKLKRMLKRVRTLRPASPPAPEEAT